TLLVSSASRIRGDRCRRGLSIRRSNMPGYRSLSAHLSGMAADHRREAEAHQRGGDAAMAAQLLEEALEASVRTRPEMPGWICRALTPDLPLPKRDAARA